MNCRHCESSDVVKFGIVANKQRYKCKDCGKSSRENDMRIKYSLEKKLKVLKLYLENVGIRYIERLEGVPNTLIIRWIRNSAAIISELSKSLSSKEVEHVEVLEMDELYSFIKKRNKIYIWAAVDRNRGKIVDFEVSQSLNGLAYEKIVCRLNDRFNIKYLCSDANYAYEKIKIAEKHFTGKSETCFVKSMNAKIRRKLARFNRKTCRYSKSLDMVIASLILLFNEDIIQCIFG